MTCFDASRSFERILALFATHSQRASEQSRLEPLGGMLFAALVNYVVHDSFFESEHLEC